ncbi:ABC-ATPase domain-containing protein [Alkalibacillus almallahensis]|uniref:ABC-ATPase domain-containing protein n=1 Tax=Alkalibacillus almallahensis TaxID=1379154 RepID=UPI00141D7BEE|nr:ABC-ATPase domain-containing protein [Alkalibacillus almallahensis]NIK13101.1 putative ABC-class ATPase [Alkalibacillus almallahensis]
MNQLKSLLQKIDQKSYKGYKDVQGSYQFDDYTLYLDYAQGDPFATPSKIRLFISDQRQSVSQKWLDSKRRRVYVEDYLARIVNQSVLNNKINIKGSGKSGMIAIDAPDQEILERTAVSVTEKGITVCLSVGLPANGRKINGKEAEKLFFQALPKIISDSVLSLDPNRLDQTLELADQHEAIRDKMNEEGWIAFVANGSVLPRASGISSKPLKQAVPFESPKENEVSFSIPHRHEPIRGMAIKQGITLIVGGGYHGKSTLLEALELGVYDHIAGDGREYVLTNRDAVKIRAEDGRSVSNVSIAPFINNLPNGTDTQAFSTENASGSTSQATNVMEALEAGASTLLIDEDTSATNFMIRDERMQQLVAPDQEPITPFVHKVKQLRDERNVSTVLVMGGSGDYFDVADDVIMMDHYQPINVTERARQIAREDPKAYGQADVFGEWSHRSVQTQSLAKPIGPKGKVQAKGKTTIMLGKQAVDLALVEQLVDDSQTRMIANMLKYIAVKYENDTPKTVATWLDALEQAMDEEGLSFTQGKRRHEHPGDLARPRRFEIAAALNRIRHLQTR